MNCDDVEILLAKAGIDTTLPSKEIINKIDEFLNAKEIEKTGHFIKALKQKKFSEIIAGKTSKEAMDYAEFIISQHKRDNLNVRGVETDYRANFSQYHHKLAEYMERARPTKFGFQNQTALHDDFIRAFEGKNKDPKMEEFYDIYMSIKDDFHKRYNEATGESLGRRRGIDHPQMSNSDLVSRVSKEEWSNDVANWVDLGEMGFTKDDLIKFITDDTGKELSLYTTISKDYRHIVEPTHDKNAVGRYKNNRFLVFKDADSWLLYQKKYGGESTYASLNDDLVEMSRELALVERFGPNPKEMFNYLLNTVGDKLKKSDGKGWASRAEQDYNEFVGYYNIPQNVRLSKNVANIKNWTGSSLLAGAPLAAVLDMVISATVLRANGFKISNSVKIASKNLFRNFTDRKKSSLESGRVMAGMEHALDTMHATSRFIETEGAGISAKVHHSVNSISGLSVWTTASKVGASAEMHSRMAKGDFNPRLLKMLGRYGIGDEQIKKFKKAGTKYDEEYKILMPNYDKMEPKIARDFIGAIKMAGLMGTLESTVRGRAKTKFGTQDGTIIGSIVRLATQFAQFATEIMVGPLTHGFTKQGKDRVSFLSSMILGTTLLGTFVVQFKQLNKGEKLYDWDDEELWIKGLLQGGALSFIGDIFFAEKGYGSGISDTIPSPSIALFNKYIYTGVFGSVSVFKDEGFKEGFEALLKNAGLAIEDLDPLKRLWYTRVLVKRMIGDNILRATNKNFEQEQIIKDLKDQQF